MVAIKIRKLLSLRGSTSIIGGGSINRHSDMEEDDDIQDAQDDLAASIANRELLLTAAAMKHTNSNSEDIRVLTNEVRMLRDEMRERFDVLEKKNTINCDNGDNVDVSIMYSEEDTARVIVGGEEELHVNVVHEELNVKEKKERLIITDRVLKKDKKNKLKKTQAKGKRRQKKNTNNSDSSVSSAAIPTGYGILTFFVRLINAIPTLLLMRRGKRLYMLVAFIAASYLFKGEMISFSGLQKEDSGRFSIGSFSFIQGVRALEDCPDQYIADNIDSYDIGSKVTIEEKVYECTESPCGWKIIGTCVGDMFLPSSASAQPTIQTLGMPVHFPSMMPSALDTDGDESNLFETDSVPAKPSLNRVRIHSTDKTRQGLFDDTDSIWPTYPPLTYPPTTSPTSSTHPTITPKPTTSISPTLGPQCEGSDPELCGCGSVNQADYRGTISTTASGKECIRWDDENSYRNPKNWPDAGLDNNNYCRNPDRDDRAWCYTADGDEECDVPICEDSLPSAYPSSSPRPTTSSSPSTHPSLSPSMQPTISPEPTISLSPTQGPQCEGSNPQVCGCASVNQTDYRGTISTTASGKECVRWDDTKYDKPKDFPDAGLEDNNYCRTPSLAYDDWDSLLVSASSWCLVPHSNKLWNVIEFCDVPFCFPPASSCPSVLDVSTNTISEELQASCAVVQCIVGADSNSNDSQALIRSEVKPDCSCAFEVWDCQFGSKECDRGPASAKSQALMKDYACCDSKLNNSNLKSSEASCECLIGPYCDAGDSSKCFEFAEYCCQEDDQQCKCDYQTRACRLALESDVEEVSAMANSICGNFFFESPPSFVIELLLL